MSYLYKSNFPQGTPQFFSNSPQSLEKKTRKFDITFSGWLT